MTDHLQPPQGDQDNENFIIAEVSPTAEAPLRKRRRTTRKVAGPLTMHAWLSLEAQKYKRRLESLIMGAVQINEGTDKPLNMTSS